MEQIKKKNTTRSIFDLSLKTIITNWSIKNQEILKELLKLIEVMNSEKKLNQYNTWKDYSLEYLKNFITIFSIDDRLLYGGITIIMISLCLYVIDASE